jgi:hypothetical protein
MTYNSCTCLQKGEDVAKNSSNLWQKNCRFCMSFACGITADECLVVLNIHVIVKVMKSVTYVSSGSVSSLCTVAQDQLQNCTFVLLSAGGLPIVYLCVVSIETVWRLRVQMAFIHLFRWITAWNLLADLFLNALEAIYVLFLPKKPVLFALASSLSQNALEISSLLEVIIVNFEECEAPRNRLLNLQRHRLSILHTFRQNNLRVTLYFMVTKNCFWASS